MTHVLTSGDLPNLAVLRAALGSHAGLNTLNGLTASSFTVVDSSVASSLTDSNGGLVFTKPATSGLDHSVAVISRPLRVVFLHCSTATVDSIDERHFVRRHDFIQGI